MESPKFETLEVGVDGQRGHLTLARPQRLNPLGSDALAEIAEAAHFLDSHRALKVVVVSGQGRAFSAGADVSRFGEADANGDRDARHDADLGRIMADTMENLNAVTVARIQGHCVGGGLVLAAACDLRIAASDVRFSIPEIDLGIPLAWGGIPRLVREIGPALTKELVMTCRPFGSSEALSAGFLNRVVAPEALDAEVEELVATLVEKPKLALLSTKRHTNAVTGEMLGMARAWSDADGLLAGLRDPEGRGSAARYLENLRARRKARG
ncbi:MAG: enoyl-CoA hydratase/isomerase family protein [Myxococcota bacterium]|jgi:enoyl-CoA hydratase/carnithine racemase|nr:enoyl-CoA hydratase/isomerase family protein [Myxococcota bacterium]